MEKLDTKKEINLGDIIEHPLKFRNIDEILNRKVVKLGNSGHIAIPVKHLGKEAQVIIWKDEKNIQIENEGLKKIETPPNTKIREFCLELKLPTYYINKIEEIYLKYKHNLVDSNPNGVAGAFIFYICNLNKYPIKKEDICKVINMGRVSLNRSHKIILENIKEEDRSGSIIR